ncbi:hypothetical protein Pmani_017239 [Petrolisthes manimaculis]|uniref:ENT domain-containing protein n=1 Tax=Petrolisthes manimaculis TaxID=1843537 RepID=A0AAE1PNT9_9EUCA|nr:hypothetical protein Pmani_017239 [Petrolisthes manimaculis]
MMDIGNKVPSSWPKLLDMTKDECRKGLRALELTTYSQVVSVLRAQGELTKEKRKLLSDLQAIFSISLERHRAEIRRAVNDEKLSTIADTLAGPNTEVEWAIEGRRLVPLMPRLPPQTPYTALASRMALVYYGINATMPPPASTALYGKMDELGGNSDDTDSEEETEGLRFLPGAMVPPQYNADQGSYTTLPYSHARLAKMPPKENREVVTSIATTTTTTSASGIGSSMTVVGGPMSLGPPGMSGGDKRKRKRSASTDHPLPPPPPPPPPREFPATPGTPAKQLGVGRPLGGPPMKITVTGNVTRGSTATPVSTLGSHTQKVILVSTSGASGVGGGVYQRSLSVPVMKSSTSSPAPPTVMRGVPASANPSSLTSATQMQSGGSVGSGSMIVPSTYTSGGSPLVAGGLPPSGTYMNRVRPRVPSSGLPPRPRQRSNSLVLQADAPTQHRGMEPGSSVTLSSGGHITSLPSFPPGSSSTSTPGPHTITPPHLMSHQTIQVRPSSGGAAGKAAIQIRQEGSKDITIICDHIELFILPNWPNHPVSLGKGGRGFWGSDDTCSAVVHCCFCPELVYDHLLMDGASSVGAGAKIITHSVGGSVGGLGSSGTGVGSSSGSSSVGMGPPSTGGRGVGRPATATTSPQASAPPLFVTNPGSITVVTRTVAAGQGTGPRVVTVNTINAPKSSSASNTGTPGGVSLPRPAQAPATVVSVGPKTIQTVRVTPQGPVGLRPVLGGAGSGGGSKSNVIVVHKGAPPPPGTRPVTIQGIRDVPTKITIGKPLSGNPGTTVLQKPLPGPLSLPRGPVTTAPTSTPTPTLTPTPTPTPTHAQQTPVTSQGGSVIVVDISPDRANINTSNALADILQGTGNSNSSSSTNSSTTSANNTTTTTTTTTSTSTTMTASSITTTTTTTTSTSTPATPTQATSTTPSTSKSSSRAGGSGGSSGGDGAGGSGGESDGEWLNLRLEGEDSPAHSLPEGQMQMLEEAVEILGRGDKESARNLLRQAGIELLDSPGDVGDHAGSEGTSISNLMAGLASQLPGAPGHLGEGGIPPVGELDPATGLFYNPSSSEGESSSDSNSNSASDDMEAGEERDAPE